MKKLLYYIFFCTSLCAALLTSCTVDGPDDEPDGPNPPPGEPGDVTLSAAIAPGGSGANDLSVADIGVQWTVGDEIGVVMDGDKTSTYKVTEIGGDAVAGLAGGLDWGESGGSRSFAAFRGGTGFVYPHVNVPGPDFTTTGSTGDHINRAFLLVASPRSAGAGGDKPVSLTFYNTMSVIEFRLATTEDSETIDKITVTTANGVFAANGKVDITASGLTFGRISATERAKEASLTISGSPALPVVTDAESPSETLSFLLPVAAEGASGAIEVALTTSKGVRKFEIPAVTFAAGKRYTATIVCLKDDDPDPPGPEPDWEDNYPMLPELLAMGLGPDANGEIILDFSRVGYKWGDEAIPTRAVKKTLSPPAGGADATTLINDAIAEVHAAGGGAVLLKKGLYNVSGTISFDKKRNVVLRGEGQGETNGTRIIGTSTAAGYVNGEPSTVLISMQGANLSPRAAGSISDIVGKYVPAGQFWVRVANPSLFKVGQDVVVKRNVTQDWIDDLQMTELAGWNVTAIDKKDMERVITKISADTLWFENPLPICIEPKYGGGKVYRYTYGDRIEGCGVENMFLGTVSTSSTNENHVAVAIYANRAQHCWVRNVTMARFAFTGVTVMQYAKNITVEGCTVLDMHSEIKGSRRYPFLIKGQLSLIKDCYNETARHAYATSSPTTNGPNVFVNCSATKCYSDNGPHQRMATGTLYDNITTTRISTSTGWAAGTFAFMDRGTADGHGWTELNGVLWNIETDGSVCVQKPWVSGTNYGIGCVGKSMSGYPNVDERDEGTMISFGKHVTAPVSLYEAQLALRKSHRPGGVMDVK